MAISVHTAVLLGFATEATYAGTSNLFAAYLADVSISWWDSEVPHDSLQASGLMITPTSEKAPPDSSAHQAPLIGDLNEARTNGVQSPPNHLVNEQSTGIIKKGNEVQAKIKLPSDVVALSGRMIYQKYYGAVVETLLKPFFFVSK